MTFYLFILRRKKAQKHMDSMLWEQEAASSSLATPIEEKATMGHPSWLFCCLIYFG